MTSPIVSQQLLPLQSNYCASQTTALIPGKSSSGKIERSQHYAETRSCLQDAAYRMPPCVRIGVKWLGESRNQNRSHSSTTDRKSSEV